MASFREMLYSSSKQSSSRLVLALDDADISHAFSVLKACAPFIAAAKVHPEIALYWQLGHAEAVEKIKQSCGGKPVILDAKLADIDSSNRLKASYYYDAGYDAIICHGYSGEDAVAAVVAEAKKRDGKGVLLLVSMTSRGNLFGLKQAISLCKMAKEARVDGVVTPGNDCDRTSLARSLLGPDMLIFSPGIGAQGGEAAEAFAAGTDFAIAGRSIIDSEDPAKAARELMDATSVRPAALVGSGLSSGLLSLLVDKGVLRFGDFTLKSGRKSAYFFNAGNLDDGKSLENIGGEVALCIRRNGLLDKFDVVFGPAYKGIPLACAVAGSVNNLFGENKRVVYDRKEAKAYGDSKDKVIVGNLKEGDRVLMVDDVITTGRTKFDAVDKLKSAGVSFTLAGLVVLFDRQEAGPDGKNPLGELEKAGLKPFVVMKARDVFDALHAMKADGKAAIDDSTYSRFQEYQKMYGVKG